MSSRQDKVTQRNPVLKSLPSNNSNNNNITIIIVIIVIILLLLLLCVDEYMLSFYCTSVMITGQLLVIGSLLPLWVPGLSSGFQA